ncbi:hypothetical protein PAAG_12106 [Paracoccidioides lutzii Pb01]|uniref:Uncharacterized protein n=1 Tax=Paracoccidioides lutzii (strain ATCC MYA-826 / Pb01) TaxID=502779 RepID=A0A0A2VJY2_PARBA|nr:hypothetical protein PAAG_12106 [Paracoccidioides lutzii Pb01]KGQ01164.1 hypothetical protein PAAG_12106 [Paracoccidioides lutzii Pb01]
MPPGVFLDFSLPGATACSSPSLADVLAPGIKSNIMNQITFPTNLPGLLSHGCRMSAVMKMKLSTWEPVQNYFHDATYAWIFYKTTNFHSGLPWPQQKDPITKYTSLLILPQSANPIFMSSDIFGAGKKSYQYVTGGFRLFKNTIS